MNKAIPSRRPRGSWWVALAVALGVHAPAVFPARAQDSKTSTKGSSSKGQDKSRKESDKDAAPEDADEKAKIQEAEDRAQTPDRWEDPRADNALKIFQPQTPVTLPSAEKTLVDQLSRGQGQLDRAVINRYVKSFAAELTNKTYITALTNPEPKPADAANAKRLETAAAELIKPLLVPPIATNAAFRRDYVAALIEAFKPLWKGNYHSRTMAMIVLSYAADPQAIPVFASQLTDPNQLAIVKLRAAVGITIVTQNGRRALDGPQAAVASKALAEFLTNEPDTFWPAQFRALEALGSVRQATDRPRNGKAEFAETAMNFLVNPKAAPNVRAWAAWALGWMEIPDSVRDYNFPLVAQSMGQAAADIGTRIAAVPDSPRSSVVRQRLADLLVQLNLGFTGETDVRNSGLLHSKHPSAGGSMAAVAEYERRVKAVTKAAIDMASAAGTQVKNARSNLVSAVDDLNSYLAKPLPNGRVLYAGGPTIPAPAPPKVATGERR